MPQQLIYTSAPRGVIAGRSGHCTVARSAAMREALMLQLEKLSYYQHLSLSGGRERPIYCCRLLDIRGSRYHVLTRIQDAGLDFTGRTNFLAHHLVFAPEEVRRLASPPVILRDWSGWVNSWTKDPELFDNEDWSSLAGLSIAPAPAVQWQQVTGDAANGYGLLEVRAGIAFHVDDLTDEQVLALFAESMELLELRDPRRDFRASAWQYTFTTSLQEQDNPADFRWRCLHSDNPAANRFAGPDCRALSEVRASKVNNEEALFARSGRQPPRFVVPPQNISSTIGETARLHAKAEGVPTPTYQWFAVDRAGQSQPIPNATSGEHLVPNPPLGITRYAVRASNSEGETTSDIITLSVEQKGSGTGSRPTADPSNRASPPNGPHIRSEGEIERQRQRLEEDQAQKPSPKWRLFLLGIVLFVGLAGAVALLQLSHKKTPSVEIVPRHDTNIEMSKLQHASNTAPKEMPTEPLPFANETKTDPNSNASLTAYRPLQIKDLWPADWSRKSIGNVPYSRADCAIGAPVRFILSTATEGLRPDGDNVFFVCQTNAGAGLQASLFAYKDDFPMPARSARGIMVRNSDSPTSPLLFIGAWSGGILACRRDPKGVFFSTNAALQKGAIILKFEKQNNQIAAIYSFDHQNWMTFEGYEFPARTQSLAGFAAWSGDFSNRVTARFVWLSANEGSSKKN